MIPYRTCVCAVPVCVMSGDEVVKTDAMAEDDSLGLPSWLEEMMKPGVGSGVFLTLKLSLIGLVLTLCCMLSFVEDERVIFHLRVFLGLSLVLTLLVFWFIGELKKDPPPTAAAVKKSD